jgi:hypothetical protein
VWRRPTLTLMMSSPSLGSDKVIGSSVKGWFSPRRSSASVSMGMLALYSGSRQHKRVEERFDQLRPTRRTLVFRGALCRTFAPTLYTCLVLGDALLESPERQQD